MDRRRVPKRIEVQEILGKISESMLKREIMLMLLTRSILNLENYIDRPLRVIYHFIDESGN